MWSYFTKWIRSKSIEEKLTIRNRLALVYAITSWNAVIYVFYLSMKDNLPKTEESKMRFVEKMKKENKEVEFITIDGFSVLRNESKDKIQSLSQLDNEHS